MKLLASLVLIFLTAFSQVWAGEDDQTLVPEEDLAELYVASQRNCSLTLKWLMPNLVAEALNEDLDPGIKEIQFGCARRGETKIVENPSWDKARAMIKELESALNGVGLALDLKGCSKFGDDVLPFISCKAKPIE